MLTAALRPTSVSVSQGRGLELGRTDPPRGQSAARPPLLPLRVQRGCSAVVRGTEHPPLDGKYILLSCMPPTPESSAAPASGWNPANPLPNQHLCSEGPLPLPSAAPPGQSLWTRHRKPEAPGCQPSPQPSPDRDTPLSFPGHAALCPFREGVGGMVTHVRLVRPHCWSVRASQSRRSEEAWGFLVVA